MTRRAPRLTPDHIFLARVQRLTWIPLTPLQRYRARMARLAEIATECGLHTIAGSLSVRSLMPRRHIDRRCLSLLKEWARDRNTWEPPLPGARASALLLLSAADETEALLRATGGAS